MANPVEKAKSYLGSVARRTFGIAAWQNAMATRSDRFPNRYETNYRWAKPINQAFDRGAVIDSLAQFTIPISARYFVHTLENWQPKGKFDSILMSGIMISAMAADTAIFATSMMLSSNLLETIALKSAANAAVHVGMDLVETALNRARTLRPPTSALAI